MKKRFIALLPILLLGTAISQAQLVGQKNEVEKSQTEKDWYNCSFEADGIYGAEVNKAYDYLKNRKKKKRPIVALLCGGMDVEHEDLKGNIWKNPKEKADGKDNDKNGYIDDLYGWNFLGGADGKLMDFTLREGDREFLRLQKLYGDYLTSNGKFYKYIDGKKVEVSAPENMQEYKYYKNNIVPESQIARYYGGYILSDVIKDYADRLEAELKERFPGQALTIEEYKTLIGHHQGAVDTLRESTLALIGIGFQLYKTDSWDVVYKNFVEKNKETARNSYQRSLAEYGNDHRAEIVKDNHLDINDTRYGNNVLLTGNAVSGTMQAGIVAAARGNDMGIDGIADAQIMTLRVGGEKGEPYLKDMALAIRYAVDKGAEIIVLPQQNTLYPPQQRRWMEEAILYAEAKGALIIVPVWELCHDLAKTTFYPNRQMIPGRELTNLMVVASSDKNGNPSMNANYGARELDLFAPGLDIHSTYPGDTYRTGSGTSFSSATVAGVAALIKSYFPKLTGAQIREILIESVTSRRGVEVEKGILVAGKRSQDLFLFEDLTLSGGIVNAYQAVIAAEKLCQ